MTEMMNATDIAFPHLGIYLKNVPKSIMIGNFPIAFYGIIISCGIVLGFCMAAWYGAKYGLDKDIYWDLSIYGVIGGIVGARIYYVIFAWDYYKDDLLGIFNIRQGGLAIYGGVIAAFIVVYFFAKAKKISPLLMFDSLAFGFLVGQSIGRWGNFTNREVFGEYTDSLLAMRLPIEAVRNRDISAEMWAHVGEGINYIQVHPTFLYESLWNLGLLATFVLLYKKKKFDGEIALWYLGGYGVGRFWIEGIRTDQLHIGGTNIAISQCVAIGCIVLACVLEIVGRAKIRRKADASGT